MADDFMDLLSGEGGQDKNDKGMEDLLGGLMGGGAGNAPGGDAGDLAGMLGGLMGSGGSGEAAGGLGGLLGGLMGGGGGAGLGGLLGGLMGGGAAEQNSFGGGGGMSLPFAGTLAEKLGISEQMANMLIMGAIGLLTSSMAKNRGRGGAVDFDSLADPDYIRSSGVAGRLSDQMGISEEDAILGLQQTMGMMAAGGQPAKPKKSSAKKTTAKKTTGVKPAASKKSTAKSTQTTPKKKKTAKKESGTDFMDLLDDLTH